ncbi:MAG TPA: lipid-binding SYLF domain-containing protein [Vicinamibacterales bacterium]|nr:lipid-binding SYLF domain-containing protein [Vicinamibacterales bacterium]
MTLLALLIALAAAASPTIAPDVTQIERARLDAAAKVVQGVHESIPSGSWSRARCVLVIPELKKAALVVGGEYGKGVMSCRAGSRWSAPVFMQLAKGSWGFQAGAEQIDLVVLVMNEDGVQKLLQNQVTLGADASVAAGPVGREGQVGTDARLAAELLSYSRAQGLFAGVDLAGGILRGDGDANRAVYGAGANPRSILANSDISAPTEAQPFLNALGAGRTEVPGPGDSSAAKSEAGRRGGAPLPAVAPGAKAGQPDEDVRARIVSVEQAIDRLLAQPAAAEVKPQLTQIRQQLDALLGALDRR